MGDFTIDSGNFTSTIKGLENFDGRAPSDFRDWHKRLAVLIGVTRREIASLINEMSRPTEKRPVRGSRLHLLDTTGWKKISAPFSIY